MVKVGSGKAGCVRGFLLSGSAAMALCLPAAALAQDEPAADTGADSYSAEAFLPNSVDCGPRSTSIRDTSGRSVICAAVRER